METPQGHNRKFLVCLCEFLGQVFFMYFVLVSGATGSDSWGITGPLALFAAINIFGGISGGHFNPAVTLGVYMREQKYVQNFLFMCLIICSQIAGAVAGMFLSVLVIRIPIAGDYQVLPGSVPLLLPSPIVDQLKGKAATADTEATAALTAGESIELTENWTTFYMEVVCTSLATKIQLLFLKFGPYSVVFALLYLFCLSCM